MPDHEGVRPGCYGSSLCYQASTVLCSACPLKAACGEQAEAMAVRLRDKYGFTSVDLRKYRADGRSTRRADGGSDELDPEVEEAGLSQNADKLVRRINALGIDLPRSLALGINAFAETGPAYMRVLLDLVLRGSFLRQEAIEALEGELSWSTASAQSHVSFALQALTHLQVMEFDGVGFQRARVMA